MEAAGASKTLVPAYQTTDWHMPQDPNLNLNIHGLQNSNLKYTAFIKQGDASQY
jgi:hypothetical protein